MAEQAIRLNAVSPDGYLYQLGYAYCMAGRYEEAITALQKFVSRHPHILHAHLALALALSEVGREEEAHTAAAEVLRISPAFSLGVLRQRRSFTEPARLERHIAALRKAGLK